MITLNLKKLQWDFWHGGDFRAVGELVGGGFFGGIPIFYWGFLRWGFCGGRFDAQSIFWPILKKLKFQPHWEQNYKWIAYSKKQEGIFCKYCVLFLTHKDSILRFATGKELWKKFDVGRMTF